MDKKKIIYMGTPHYAKEILQAIIDAADMDVSLVITQPDRPIGRRQIITSPSVKILAKKYDIEVLQPTKLSNDGIKERIQRDNPDFIIVAAFGQLLPKNILDIASCINLHASLLPKYRGASPVQQSLLNGDKITGVTSMLMDEGLDTGDILETIEFKIPKDMMLSELTEQLTRYACKVALSTIRNFDKIVPLKQDETRATLCKKIKKSDGEVDMKDASQIYNKYRAFEGWPGIFTAANTKIYEVSLLDTKRPHRAFEILVFDDESVILGCEMGSIKIGKLQAPGKKPMSAKAYCIGRGLGVGDFII